MLNGKCSYSKALCCIPEEELYYYKLHRIKSFASFQNENVSCLFLAEIGMKCEDDGESVKCVSCKKSTLFTSETLKYSTKYHLQMALHHPYCSWRNGYHPLNIPTTQEKEDEGRKFLKDLKSQYRTDKSKKKSRECKGIITRVNTTANWEGNLQMMKALIRMCPCDKCESRYLKDNLRIAQSSTFSVTNTMAGPLKYLLKIQEKLEFVECIYQRQRVFISDECFVKTGIPGHSKCVSCQIEYYGDENGEDISVWHAQNAPYCPLLKMVQGANFIHKELMKLEDRCRLLSSKACGMDVKEVEAIMNLYSNNPSNLDPKSAMNIEDAYITFFFENGFFPADGGTSIINKLYK